MQRSRDGTCHLDEEIQLNAEKEDSEKRVQALFLVAWALRASFFIKKFYKIIDKFI